MSLAFEQEQPMNACEDASFVQDKGTGYLCVIFSGWPRSLPCAVRLCPAGCVRQSAHRRGLFVFLPVMGRIVPGTFRVLPSACFVRVGVH